MTLLRSPNGSARKRPDNQITIVPAKLQHRNEKGKKPRRFPGYRSIIGERERKKGFEQREKESRGEKKRERRTMLRVRDAQLTSRMGSCLAALLFFFFHLFSSRCVHLQRSNFFRPSPQQVLTFNGSAGGAHRLGGYFS